ncbi:MAG TPA: WbqC family protein, partial [Anaerolineales bacterium]|nr:WbqC family protein [Anaerolineales bacterium]
MIAVILQPSYIPWRGYFDQIRRADVFIFYDDVQYDKHGWRNRNQIKTAQGKKWLTVPVHSGGVTAGTPIKDVQIDWSKPWAETHLKSLTASYSKAPHFMRYTRLLEAFYSRRDAGIADLTISTTIELARELGMTSTRFLRSSELSGIQGQKTQRLIQILQQVGATHYISGPSAREYIQESAFSEAGISVEYMVYEYPEYPQLYPPYNPYVSVLDLLFMTGDKAMDFITG